MKKRTLALLMALLFVLALSPFALADVSGSDDYETITPYADYAFVGTSGTFYFVSNTRNYGTGYVEAGTEVKVIQASVNFYASEKRLSFSCGTPDGYWGSNTTAGVRSFQTNQGIASDGIVGPTTLSVLWNRTANELGRIPGI